jgi:sulfate permease, SulP family
VSGMMLSLLVVIYRASNPHIATLAKVPGTNYFRNTSRFDNLEEREDALMVRIDGPIYFANLNFIKKKLDKWVDAKKELRSVILNFESIPSVDSSGAHELEDWIKDWKSKGIQVYITGVRGPVRDILFKWHIIHEIGEDHLFADDATAVDFIDQKLDSEQVKKITPYIIQTSDKK